MKLRILVSVMAVSFATAGLRYFANRNGSRRELVTMIDGESGRPLASMFVRLQPIPHFAQRNWREAQEKVPNDECCGGSANF
jgi:hypothetical protein